MNQLRQKSQLDKGVGMREGESILIIDDETEIGEILVDLLSPEYEKVVFANHPQKAKELLTKESFSIIMSDVNMPELKGPDLIRLLRASGNLTPVVFLTGAASKDTVLTAIRLGVSDVLEKPFDAEELIKSLDRVLEIDKRRTQLILDKHNNKKPEDTERQQKMLGLLHVANEKKKVG